MWLVPLTLQTIRGKEVILSTPVEAEVTDLAPTHLPNMLLFTPFVLHQQSAKHTLKL